MNATTMQAWAEHDDETRPSWEACPPYIISITQWQRGRSGPRGPSPGIIDRTAARAALRARAEAESRALRAARSALVARTPCTLSELEDLDPDGFEILFDAIGEAFSQIGPKDQRGEATTADGGLLVRIELPAAHSELVMLRLKLASQFI